jgi:hypothetical protein
MLMKPRPVNTFDLVYFSPQYEKLRMQLEQQFEAGTVDCKQLVNTPFCFNDWS